MSKNKVWRCPRCETMNTGKECVVCGHQSPVSLPDPRRYVKTALKCVLGVGIVLAAYFLGRNSNDQFAEPENEKSINVETNTDISLFVETMDIETPESALIEDSNVSTYTDVMSDVTTSVSNIVKEYKETTTTIGEKETSITSTSQSVLETSNNENESTTTSVKPFDEINISISWWGGDSRHEATKKAINAFMEKYPHIKVDSKFGAWSGWEEAMYTAFYAGTAPDINQINFDWIEKYSADGSVFLDMNNVSDKFDLSQYSQKELDTCTFAGELQAIPVSMTGRIFCWNKSSFDKAGIGYPKSLKELYNAGEKFNTNLGSEYFPLVLGEYDRMILMVYYLESKYGKVWVKNNVLNYNVDEIKDGFDFIDSLEDRHVVPTIPTLYTDGFDSVDRNIKWQDGRYAGVFEWDSSISKFDSALNEGQELVVGDYFSDFGNTKGGFSKVSLAFAISENTRYPDESAMLLDFLLNNDEGTALMASQRGIPLSRAAFKNCKEKGLLDVKVAEANKKILDWVSFNLDSKFEDSHLRGNPDGVYFDAIGGLSYNEYDSYEAAHILYDGINTVLNS